MLRILFIIPEYPPDYSGGISTYYRNLLPALANAGISVTAIVGSGLQKGPDGFTDNGVTIIPIDDARTVELRRAFPQFSLAPFIVRHLAAAWAAFEQANGGRDFDIIECTDWGLFFVPWILNDRTPPLVVRLHGSDGQISHYDPGALSQLHGCLSQLIEAALLPRAQSLATISANNQAYWQALLHRHVCLVDPPMNIEASLRYRELKPQHHCYRDGLVVGRVQQWKGPSTLCRALYSLGESSPHVTWIGRSVYSLTASRDYSTILAQQYPSIWGVKISHLTHQTPEEIKLRQALAGFVIVPSDWDVFNLTVAEAMAQEVVVICSRGAGASALIQDGYNGFLFNPGDHTDLAQAILKVQRLPKEELRIVGVNARETVLHRLSPSIVVAKMLQHYHQVAQYKAKTRQSDDLHGLCLRPLEADSFLSNDDIIKSALRGIDLKVLSKYTLTRLVKRIVCGQS